MYVYIYIYIYIYTYMRQLLAVLEVGTQSGDTPPSRMTQSSPLQGDVSAHVRCHLIECIY